MKYDEDCRVASWLVFISISYGSSFDMLLYQVSWAKAIFNTFAGSNVKKRCIHYLHGYGLGMDSEVARFVVSNVLRQ